MQAPEEKTGENGTPDPVARVMERTNRLLEAIAEPAAAQTEKEHAAAGAKVARCREERREPDE